MFNHNRRATSAHVVRVWQPIQPSLTREAQFNAWLESHKLRCCQYHRKTVMVLDREASQHASFHPNAAYHFFMEGPPPPSQDLGETHYPFQADFHCPACRLSCALCPPEFHETSFETFDTSTPEQARALACCREYAAQVSQHGRGFALFVGLTGTGKTRLACNIIREVEKPGDLYVRQAQLTEALRATYGRRPVEYDDEGYRTEPESSLETAQKATFLVLDEIGCGPLANDERQFLDELIKHRYDGHKPTILISNLPLQHLKEYLGDALTDRIRSATGNGKFILQFSGESFRRTTGEDYLMPPD
jgi:DNA replication protein DnaC